ncbi:MAG: hypothetical protein WC284_17725 [Candidimonas sp.]
MTDRFDETIRRLERLRQIHSTMSSPNITNMKEIYAIGFNGCREKQERYIDEANSNDEYKKTYDDLFSHLVENYDPLVDIDGKKLYTRLSMGVEEMLSHKDDLFPIAVAKVVKGHEKMIRPRGCKSWKWFTMKYNVLRWDWWTDIYEDHGYPLHKIPYDRHMVDRG